MKPPERQPQIVKLPEWRSAVVEGQFLAEEDRQLAGRLASGGDGRLLIDELRTGLRIAARSWVGLIRFSTLEIQVVPKLVGDNLGLVELIDYATGLDSLDRYPTVRTLEGGGTSLFDLIALLFVEGCERVIRGGLLSDYCETEDALPVVRGRIMIRRQILKRFGRIDHLECRYDEYLTDIPENRILLAGLQACSGRVRHPAVAMRVRRLLAILSEACVLEDTDLRQVRATLIYNRMSEHYREAHELAWLILDGLGIEDIYATGSHRCFAFLLDMNKLFENFIARWMRDLFAGSDFRVLPQRRDRTILWNADLGRPYKSVIPDLLVERRKARGRFLPVDAKYKLYDDRAISPGDIYQTFLYAYAYGEHHSVMPTALVLYPASVSGNPQVRLNIRRSGGSTSAQLRALPIHIPTALAEARSGHSGPTTNVLRSAVEATWLP